MAQPNTESGSSSPRNRDAVVLDIDHNHDAPVPESVSAEVSANGNTAGSFIVQVPPGSPDSSSSESQSDEEGVIRVRDGQEPNNSIGGRFNAVYTRFRDTYQSVVGNNETRPQSDQSDGDDPDDAASQRLAWQFLTQPPVAVSLVLMFIVSLFLVVVKEMSIHSTLLISTIVSLLHYHDSVRFTHILAGVPNIKLYTVFLGILMRNGTNYVFWQTFEVYKMAFLIPTPGGEESFFITLTRIIQAEIFVLDIALIIKATVHCYKWIPEGFKQRVYIWIDHTCYVYRMLIPASQWALYFNSSFLLVAYLMFKVYTLITRINVWFKFTRAVMSNVNLGVAVSNDQLEPDSNCSICQSVYRKPRKLECTHIFCADCIRTWVDTGKGDTCPLCRSQVCDAQVPKIKDYDTFFPINVF